MLGSSDDDGEPGQAGAAPAPASQQQQLPLDFQDSAPGPQAQAHMTSSMADLQPTGSGRHVAGGAAPQQQPPLQCGGRAKSGASRFNMDSQASQVGGSQPGPASQQQLQPATSYHQQQQQLQQGLSRPAASVPSMPRGTSRPAAAAAAAKATAARPHAQHSAPAALPARHVLPPQGAHISRSCHYSVLCIVSCKGLQSCPFCCPRRPCTPMEPCTMCGGDCSCCQRGSHSHGRPLIT